MRKKKLRCFLDFAAQLFRFCSAAFFILLRCFFLFAALLFLFYFLS